VTRVAAVDCGTNTIKLLVADVDRAGGRQDDLVREMRVVRLGQGVDGTGRIAEEALQRVFAATEEYAAVVEANDVDVVRFVATSAARDADNADVFAAGIETRIGVRPEVVSGAEEARLSYDGATRSLPDVGDATPVAVLDIGGGSTELILGDPVSGSVHASHSLDIGSVRLTERLLPTDPPTPAQVQTATRLVEEALDELAAHGVHVEEAPTVVGVAGTVTTVATLLLGLDHWDRDRVHHASFALPEVHALAARLLSMTVAEREALGVPRGRSDVIGAGALILDRVLARSSAERLTVSDSDILDGIAWSLA
jgi:exopolyphosphatase/guanosine-5'-triphosphate,3'-diphosphate pyrophosphatase